MGITLNQLTNTVSKVMAKIKDKYVPKENDKGLSTNDYTNEDKSKVAKIDTIENSIEQVSSQIDENANLLNARMDTFTKLEEGSTTADAELKDIRVGADGTTYENAGESVRGQISKISKNVNDQITNLNSDFSDIKTEMNYFNGEEITVEINNKAYGQYEVGNVTTSGGGIVRITPSYYELDTATYFVYFKGKASATSKTKIKLGIYNLNGYKFGIAEGSPSVDVSTNETEIEAYGVVDSSKLIDGRKCFVFYAENGVTVTLTSNNAIIVPYSNSMDLKVLLSVCRNSNNGTEFITLTKKYISEVLVPAIEDTRPLFPLFINENEKPMFNLYNSYIRASRLVMIGDSTTDVAVSNYFDEMMKNYTKSGEVLEGTEIINMGKGGTTINWFLTDKSDQIGTAIAYNANIYTLCYGINDVREGNCTKETLIANLKTCVDRLLAETQGSILLITPNTMLLNDVGGYNYVVPNLSAQVYSTLLKEAYIELNAMYASDRVQLVDMQELIFGSTCVNKADTPFMSDQLHPNTLGQRCRADVIANSIGRKVGVQLNKVRWVEQQYSDDILSHYPMYVEYKGYEKVLSNIEIISIDNDKAVLSITESDFSNNVKIGDVILFGNEYAKEVTEIKTYGYGNYYFYADFNDYAGNCNAWHISIYRPINI